MEMPVKVGTDVKSLKYYGPKYHQAMDSELLEVGLSSGSTPKTLKVPETQDTARRYWEQIFKDGASGMPPRTL